MKNLALIFGLLFIVSCKKKEITPIPPRVVTPTCPAASNVFEGKWRNVACNHDTINIVFVSNNCQNTVNAYQIYGLNRSVDPCLTTHTLNLSYMFNATVNESSSPKVGSLNGYNGSLVRKENDTTVYISMPNEGDFYFNKIK